MLEELGVVMLGVMEVVQMVVAFLIEMGVGMLVGTEGKQLGLLAVGFEGVELKS